MDRKKSIFSHSASKKLFMITFFFRTEVDFFCLSIEQFASRRDSEALLSLAFAEDAPE